MLGKQWLNRYASIDMRGSAIERNQNRQRKLDGIVTWYFDHVMESLPLMLQLALLLLGCALSLYLWGIDTTVALVVLGVTSFGVASYIFFVLAGTASASCPYQTPGAQILRHILPLTQSVLHSTFSSVVKGSWCLYGPITWWGNVEKTGFTSYSLVSLLKCILLLPYCLVHDTYALVRAMIRVFFALAHSVHGWFRDTRGSYPQSTLFDLQCITWVLQTSLDKSIHLLTLKLLSTMTTLADFNPALVSACFDILAGCVPTVGGKMVVAQGSEELAEVSALCCLRMLPHLTTMDPTSSAFKDMRRRYTKTFPLETNFEGFPSYHRFGIIHNTFYPSRKVVLPQFFYRPKIQWKGCEVSSSEHAVLIQLARFEYQRKRYQKVPRWILRFAYHLLSKEPLPPASVVADCLSIVAMDMGCTAPTLDERCVHI